MAQVAFMYDKRVASCLQRFCLAYLSFTSIHADGAHLMLVHAHFSIWSGTFSHHCVLTGRTKFATRHTSVCNSISGAYSGAIRYDR